MDNREILRDYVSDMYGVEKHCLEAIQRQTGDEKFTPFLEAHQLLTKIENILRSHTQSLDQCLSALDGGAGTTLSKAASTAMGAIAGIYGKFRAEDPVSRSLRDDYTSLNLAAIGYTMLHTTACALGDRKVADLALRHLHEITPCIVSLSRIIPEVVAEELYQEGKVTDPSVWREAASNTQQAWSHNVVGEYH